LKYNNFFPNKYFNTKKDIFNYLYPVSKENKFISGNFSFWIKRNNSIYLVRDHLGINSFFYSFVKNKLILSNTIIDLLKSGVNYDDIFSVPPGGLVKINRNGIKNYYYYYIKNIVNKSENNFDLSSFQRCISEKLLLYLEELNNSFPNAEKVLCLSGGLDSSIICYLSNKIFPNLHIASFSLLIGSSRLSTDFKCAEAIAEHLGNDFIPVIVNKNEIIGMIKECMVLCQDWRDFNLHCAVVNYFIAKKLKLHFGNKEVVVITGDLMNEYVSDYSSVYLDGKEYYRQPQILKSSLAKILAYGLDTSDREIGVFNHFDIKTFQPYSVVFEEYLQLPKDLINNYSKEHLNNKLIKDNHLLGLVNKKKTRAQVGDKKDKGVLGVFHNSEIDSSVLKKYWISIFSEFSDSENYFKIINLGRYKNYNSREN